MMENKVEKAELKEGAGGKLYRKVECNRCVGSRVFRCWAHIEQGKCFRCGGTGYEWVRYYTPAQEERRAKARAKQQAKKDAERAAKQAEWEAQEAIRVAKEAELEAQRAAERAKSQHVGAVGARMELDVQCVATFDFDGFRGASGYGYVLKCGDNKLLLFASKAIIPFQPGDWRTAKGWAGRIKATIKRHGERNGEKQTTIQRVKVAE